GLAGGGAVNEWPYFTGTGRRPERPDGKSTPVTIPDAPSWRSFRPRGEDDPFYEKVVPKAPDDRGDGNGLADLGDEDAVWMVNAALLLRRPLLVTGPPGSGKSAPAQLGAR